tara:strand:+ start:1028 stop:2722 length:1695 start_codon:yes stop_codon:yes gene_type:complete
MSAYKKFNQQDAYISTYTAHKSWVASGSQYRELGINNIVGLSGSGDFYDLTPGNVIGGSQLTTSSTAYNRRLIYESTQHLYYSNFVNGVVPTSSSYDNYLQSSFEASGSRIINDRLAIFSLPKEMYGTHLEPLSISITPDLSGGSDSLGSLDNYVSNNYVTNLGVDSIASLDNLYTENVDFLFGSTESTCALSDNDYILNEGTYVNETPAGGGEFLDNSTVTPERNCNEIIDDGEGRLYLKYSTPRVYVGNAIYTHGQLIITDVNIAHYYNTYLNAVLKWKSNLPIYTHNYHCRLKNSEFNYTLNRTTLEKENNSINGKFNTKGKVAGFITGSDYSPYISTVGLYNDSNQLIAVGKLGRPTPKSLETDMSIIVKLDMNFSSDRLLGGRSGSFIPSDPAGDTPPDFIPCKYVFTFQNWYTETGKGKDSRTGTVGEQEDRIINDYGSYKMWRKKDNTPASNIIKGVDTNVNYTLLHNQRDYLHNVTENLGTTERRRANHARCYTDIVVTTSLDQAGNLVYSYDFTTHNTNSAYSRPQSFYRRILNKYLYHNRQTCKFESSYMPMEV